MITIEILSTLLVRKNCQFLYSDTKPKIKACISNSYNFELEIVPISNYNCDSDHKLHVVNKQTIILIQKTLSLWTLNFAFGHGSSISME